MIPKHINRPGPERHLAKALLFTILLPLIAHGQTHELPYPASTIAVAQIDSQRTSIGHGDNFPVTWGSDGNVYTAFSDGYGFGGNQYLSNGQSKIFGSPPYVTGSNIYSPTGQQAGNGSSGRKASGLLMVNGVLYEWLRNLYADGTGSSLGWSRDFGSSWTWSDSSWRMPHIGYPTWLNAGQNYGDRQDEYAYFYSPDGPSAYVAYSGLMLGRVPIGSITDQSTYEYYAGTDPAGQPRWTHNFAQHQPVFTNTHAGVFRASVVYNAPLGRYLLTTTNSYDSPSNYLGIFEAPTPWGPWTTVAYIKGWGQPSETRFQPQIPSKWISGDGLSFYLQYSCYPSGPYQFNLQRVVLSRTGAPVAAAPDVTTGAPVITTQPVSQTVPLGGTATFSVAATGNPTFVWRRNGATFGTGWTHSSLTLARVSWNDFGTYTVTATNAYGSVTSVAATLGIGSQTPVNVSSAPVITMHPVSQSTHFGGSVTFTVAATGNPSFVWRRNGSTFGPGWTGSSLTLSTVTANDVGSYSVTATNSSGTVTSVPATFTVY